MEPIHSLERSHPHRARPGGVAAMVSLGLHGVALVALVAAGSWPGGAPSAEVPASAPSLEVTLVMDLPVAPPAPASFVPPPPAAVPAVVPATARNSPPRPAVPAARPKVAKPVAVPAAKPVAASAAVPVAATAALPVPAEAVDSDTPAETPAGSAAAQASASGAVPSPSDAVAAGAVAVATAPAAALTGGPPPVVRTADYLSPPSPPSYPPLARRLGIEGTVVVRALVDRPGQPAEVTVWRSSGESVLDRSALAAVRGWRFRPMTHGGAAIAAWVEIPITFSIANT